MLGLDNFASDPFWRDKLCINIGMLAIVFVVVIGAIVMRRMMAGPRRPPWRLLQPRPYRSEEEYQAEMEAMEEESYWMYRDFEDRRRKRREQEQHKKDR